MRSIHAMRASMRTHGVSAQAECRAGLVGPARNEAELTIKAMNGGMINLRQAERVGASPRNLHLSLQLIQFSLELF